MFRFVQFDSLDAQFDSLDAQFNSLDAQFVLTSKIPMVSLGVLKMMKMRTKATAIRAILNRLNISAPRHSKQVKY